MITIVRGDRTIRCVCVYVLVFLLRRTHCFSGKLGLDERRRAVTATESVDPLETTVDTFFLRLPRISIVPHTLA